MPTHDRRDFSERGVAAEGDDARAWLKNHGVTVASSGSFLRCFGDVLGSEELTLSRVWHSARHVERRGVPGGAVLSLLVEGTLTVRFGDGREIDVDEGGGFVHWSLAPPPPVTVLSEGRCGTLEVAVGREFLERFFAWTGTGVTPIPPGLATTRILLATAITTLATSIETTDPTWISVRSMIESGVSAVLAETGPALHPSVPVTALRLLRDAHALIERECRDVSFDVRALATALSVSMTTLYAAFERSESTPAQAIRLARVGLARRMLERRITPTAADHEAIAELAGFPSAASMLKALRADRHRRSQRTAC
ncbi:hypothetical protein [Rathayibacter toxicus]|uniref:hypothetical protein n=1 Tax=Rathayibacter toxicus TaxID=145458 RepID=UPI001C04392B|nr:hypothetical protein [Rathayibacter toxicus]QWL31562.1 AraC family transcriptional regulator [Rathayibacter toxicus]QWL33654.1 AraC family transcriptional regulator [Rathayibacter toxicus]QWL35789.1 AraC family transcriptional regulator [Rathayibacter toxicus]QWL37878.1 AraC family transcriptional regulator [Rathayibacter toxicus]QWL39968.1 AraC family transcriptional regulator [Rathayibacter toxicus]